MDLALILPLALLLGAALLAGIAGGLLGIGGGTILVPAYLLILSHMQVPRDAAAKMAIATSLATIVLLAAGSVHGHLRKGSVYLRDILWLSVGGMTGAAGGSALALSLPGSMLISAFGLFCALVGSHMLLKKTPNSTNEFELSAADTKPMKEQFVSIWRLLLVGFTAGAMSSLFGVGGGVVAVPLLLFIGLTMHRAIANSSGMIILNALAGTGGYLSASSPILPPGTGIISSWSVGYVVWPAALIVGLIAYNAARAGAHLAHRIRAERLKRLFALFLIGLGIAFAGRLI